MRKVTVQKTGKRELRLWLGLKLCGSLAFGTGLRRNLEEFGEAGQRNPRMW
jgi:hypothetical protein